MKVYKPLSTTRTQVKFIDSLKDETGRALATNEVLLGDHVQSSINDPAVVFPGKLVEGTMVERKSGIPLIHVAPFFRFMLSYAVSFFLGATFDGNGNEEEHLHPAQSELYLPTRGKMRIKVWYGVQYKEYHLAAGDAILIPPGRWHLVEWIEPGWCWVIKGPNNLAGNLAKVTRKMS